MASSSSLGESCLGDEAQDEHQGDEHPGESADERQQAHLLARLAGRSPEAQDDRDHRGQARDQGDDRAGGDDHARHGREGVHAERVLEHDPVLTPVVERAGAEQEPEERDGGPSRQADDAPSPPRPGKVSVGVQEEEHRQEGERIERVLADRRPDRHQRDRARLHLQAVDHRRLPEAEEREQHARDDEEPSRPVRRLPPHDQHADRDPAEQQEHEDDEGDVDASLGLDEDVAVFRPALELVDELTHARCVEVSDHDDGARLDAIADREVHDAGDGHRRHAERKDADREEARESRAHASRLIAGSP